MEEVLRKEKNGERRNKSEWMKVEWRCSEMRKEEKWGVFEGCEINEGKDEKEV